MTLNNEPTEPLVPLEQATRLPQNTQPGLPQNAQARPPQQASAKLRRLFVVGSVILIVIIVGVIGSVFALQLRSSLSPRRGAVAPTALPTAPGVLSTPTSISGTLTLNYQTQDTNPTSNQIQMGLELVNTGSNPIALTGITIRYWYTADSPQQQVIACDYATVGCANIQSQFGQLNPPQSTADTFLQIGFTTGSLAARANTQIQIRIHRSNWSNYNQSNDYSFAPEATTFSSTQHIGIYQQGQLISGVAPA